MKDLKKPPLGIMSKRMHDKFRTLEVLDAIRRYTEAGLMYPQEWLTEVIDYVTTT